MLSDEDDILLSGQSDDSFDDSEWIPKKRDDYSSEDDVNNAQMDAGNDSECSEPPVQAAGANSKPQGEILVFMNPPEEKGLDDTDVDSGKFLYLKNLNFSFI